MEMMSEAERYENGVLSRELVLPPHLVAYLAQLSLSDRQSN